MRTCDEPRADGAPCTLEPGHQGRHSDAGSEPYEAKPIGTILCVKCPTCSERFELALRDGGSMWGNTFTYRWTPSARRWLPRLRAFFRLFWRDEGEA